MPFYVLERRHDAMYLGGETWKVQEGKKTLGKSEEVELEQNQLRENKEGQKMRSGEAGERRISKSLQLPQISVHTCA